MIPGVRAGISPGVFPTMSVSAVLGTITLPFLTIAGTPARRQRQLERTQSVKEAREAAIQDAYDAQDADKLVTAIFTHVSRLYMQKGKAPYRECGSRYNAELASAVTAEVLRKLPWLNHPDPLTPYDPTRSKFSHFVNHLARSRHLDLVTKHWNDQSTKRDRENQLPQYEAGSLTDITVVGAISDERRDVLAEFLATLTPEQQELAANLTLAPADRSKWRAITRKAATYGHAEPLTAPVASPRPQRDRTWSMRCSALYKVKAEYGVITTTAALFKRYGLAARTQRPDGWQFEPTRNQRFANEWATDGKSWTKKKLTGDDYDQMRDPECRIPLGRSLFTDEN
jgi:hypothetical protein